MPAVNLTRNTWLATRVRRAESFVTRLFGLLGRKTLSAEEALWIVPCKGVHTFGMRFAIDVIFLDPDERVVRIRERLSPGRLSPIEASAHSVLELPAGTIGKSRTEPGDQLDISLVERAALEDLTGDSLTR